MLAIVLPEDDSMLDRPGPIKTWVLVVSVFLVAWSLLIYGYVVFAVPAFGELYAGFGAELPTLTAAVINYSRYSTVCALIGIVPLVSMWRNRSSGSRSQRRNFKRVIISFSVSLAVGGLTMAGLYLPVFRMGAVVS